MECYNEVVSAVNEKDFVKLKSVYFRYHKYIEDNPDLEQKMKNFLNTKFIEYEEAFDRGEMKKKKST